MAFAALLRSAIPSISRSFTTTPPHHIDPFPTSPFSLTCTSCTGSMGEMHLASWYGRVSTAGLRLIRYDAATGDDVAEPASSTQEIEHELLPSTWATPHHAATRTHARLIGCLDDATCHPYARLDGTSVMVAEALRPAISYRAGLDCEEYDHRDADMLEGRPVGPYDVQIPLTQIDDEHWLILRRAVEPSYTRVPCSRSTGDWASHSVSSLPDVFRAQSLSRLSHCIDSDDDDDDADDDDDDDMDSVGGDPGFELPSTDALDGLFYGGGFDDELMFHLEL